MSSISVNTITDASGGATTSINGFTPTVSNMAGRNRIINGDMRIDQRNNGAAYIITGDSEYGLDRFQARTYGGSGRFSMQQVSEAPAGFTNSLKVTVTTTDTSGTAGYSIEQRIEGLNITDFNFGSVNAKTYTVSFWVKASIAGTYTLGNRTNNATASCVNTYTINSANTWEKKIITFPANTDYTTSTGTNIGILCDFGFGAQTSKSTSTLGVWQAGNYVFNSGQVDLMQTSGATWQVTGVQLEAGSVATPFEHRQYGQELALCQRYYEIIAHYCGNTSYGTIWSKPLNTFTNCWTDVRFKVTKRAPGYSFGLLGSAVWAGATPAVNVSGVDAIVFQGNDYYYLTGGSTSNRNMAYVSSEL